MANQEEIFMQVFDKYKKYFPEMLHCSGGLPDSKGEGTSDVDICLYHKDFKELLKYFPDDTEIHRYDDSVVYELKGYPREVAIFCTDQPKWKNGFLHRKTELALNERFPELRSRAFSLKKESGIGTEEAWARVLGLDHNFFETLLDTDKTLRIAEKIQM